MADSQGKRKPLSPTSLASGALSFGLLMAHAMVAQQALPTLRELLRTEPRLAMIGFLAVVALPALFVTLLHHAGHRMLDRVDRASRPALPKIESWWAGTLTWLVMYGTSILARLAYFIVNPPAPRDGLSVSDLVEQTIAEHAHLGNAFSVYAMLWIAIASALYELERQTRR